MQDPKNFNKKLFLKHLILGLRISNSFPNPIRNQQTKKSIKLSADMAMAFARGETRWTRALISKLSAKQENKPLLMSILGSKYDSIMAKYTCPLSLHYKMQRTKKIIRASRKRSYVRVSSPSFVASNLVKKRTKILRKLVPGCEDLDGLSLLSETLDYVKALKAQVDLMQALWKAAQITSSRNNWSMLKGKEISCCKKLE